MGRGKEAARQIRLGARNAKLALFNVAPLRTNAGRKAAVLHPPAEPPAATPPPTPAKPDPTKG